MHPMTESAAVLNLLSEDIVSIHFIKGSYQYSSSILSELHIDITKMTRAAKLSSHSFKAN